MYTYLHAYVCLQKLNPAKISHSDVFVKINIFQYTLHVQDKGSTSVRTIFIRSVYIRPG